MKSKINDITFSQIFNLIDILCNTTSSDVDFIKSKYSDIAIDYNSASDFLSNLSLIEQKEKQITISPELKSLFKENNTDTLVKIFLLQKMINHNSPFREEVLQFLKLFELRGNDWTCTLTTEQRLGYSGIRNLLIDLDCIEYDSNASQYLLLLRSLLLLKDSVDSFAITRKELSKLLEKREELGRNAELRIIEYEKQRLKEYPNLISKIKHIADDNVRAGFDILSFDGLDLQQSDMERLIEVKAVSMFSFKFYWSANEVNKAREAGNSYYLYLLPVESKLEFNITKLQVIRNPFVEIFSNPSKWEQSCESYCFKLT
jgi:hypothetical protein